ncbi:hypothetical protein GIB67_017353 [Kingdonia uniflora]|uniref:Bulb-type lectin domain-containing protein n=1 Tax=Kingdonia uniflora TaxID=39325 RepID=A0A7J7MPF3_9MAGN|nr:hypothetical protein GIB67_017353 [Kingdonia uniflora]
MNIPIAELLDSGNLVLTDGNDGNLTSYFYHPTSDILLPSMKLEWGLKTRLNRYLSAWKNFDNPSIGYLTYGIVNTHEFPEAAMRKGLSGFY